MRRVEFGFIMLWFYVVDRTTVFTPYGTKVILVPQITCRRFA